MGTPQLKRNGDRGKETETVLELGTYTPLFWSYQAMVADNSTPVTCTKRREGTKDCDVDRWLLLLSPFLLSCGVPMQQVSQVTPAHKYLLHIRMYVCYMHLC